jgi:hypothetical protein
MANPSAEKDRKPNPTAAMSYFFIATSVYCIISVMMAGDTKQQLITKACYILIVILGEFFINLNLSDSMCGVRQWQTTMFVTLIPWIMIFGLLHMFLFLFPGWLSPFSNTFGYLIAKLMGLPDLMKEILVPIGENETTQALMNISTDPSLLVNQFSPEASSINPETGEPIFENFDKAWNRLKSGGIIQQNLADEVKLKTEFYGFVRMKYTVSEYIWNLLTGFLVTSISYNYIVNTACIKSAHQMKILHDAYETNQDKKLAADKTRAANQPTYVQQA